MKYLYFAILIALAAVIVLIYLTKNRSHASHKQNKKKGPNHQVQQNEEQETQTLNLVICREIQDAYWTFNANEYLTLNRTPIEELNWNQRLRFLHLECMKSLNEGSGREELINTEFSDSDGHALNTPPKLKNLIDLLSSNESPYRPRFAQMWKHQTDAAPESVLSEEPDLQGKLSNASYTHFGALEVLYLDEADQPAELGFIPFDDLWTIVTVGASEFSPARLVYENERDDEVVLLPVQYGISWKSPHEFDKDGSMTRFICHVNLGNGNQTRPIGVGQQDLCIESGSNASLFGISAVAKIEFSLVLGEAGFDEKCRARGLDPDLIKKQMGK